MEILSCIFPMPFQEVFSIDADGEKKTIWNKDLENGIYDLSIIPLWKKEY